MSAKIGIWAAEPLQADVRLALDRLAEAEDIAAIAVMPDVHLAHGVCIGTVTATHTRRRAAVGAGTTSTTHNELSSSSSKSAASASLSACCT